MNDILIPVRKFVQLLDYLETIKLNPVEIAQRINLDSQDLANLPPDQRLSGLYYCRLYKEAVVEMQKLNRPLPWGAGIGSDAFELICYCLIGCRTLGDALARVERFDRFFYPLAGYSLVVTRENAQATLAFRINMDLVDEVFVPEDWDGAASFETISKVSGLLVWHALCGWLIGRSVEASEVRISAPFLAPAYHQGMAKVFDCPVIYDSTENSLIFPESILHHRVVHTTDSLDDFLGDVIYQLVAIKQKPASTSAAIKSLISIDFKNGPPGFSEIAESLHMSESSLRRRLLKENTSFQVLKDEVRCAKAIEHLRNDDMKIHELSDLLGYTEPSSFVRSFRNWTGVTPKVYKDNLEPRSE